MRANDGRAARVPAVIVEGFTLGTEVPLDADWNFNRRLYELWAIYEHWPEGYLLSLSGPDANGVMIQAIWRSQDHERNYMTTVGVERYTEAVRVLSEEGYRPVDVLPQNKQLTSLIFGPLAKEFIDIGADLDEAAAKRLDMTLTAIDLVVNGFSGEDDRALWAQLDLTENCDPRLVMRLAVSHDGSIKNTLVWSSEEAAREFVDQQLIPAIAEIAPGSEQSARVELREIKRLAIGSSELAPETLEALGL